MIRDRIKANRYETLAHMHADFEKMFTNAMTYNADGSEVFENARIMKTGLEQELRRLYPAFVPLPQGVEGTSVDIARPVSGSREAANAAQRKRMHEDDAEQGSRSKGNISHSAAPRASSPFSPTGLDRQASASSLLTTTSTALQPSGTPSLDTFAASAVPDEAHDGGASAPPLFGAADSSPMTAGAKKANLTPKAFHCAECGSGFSRPNNLKRHMVQIHGLGRTSSPLVQGGLTLGLAGGLGALIGSPLVNGGGGTARSSPGFEGDGKRRVSKESPYPVAAQQIIEMYGNGEPMHYREITRRAMELGLINPMGRTPENTMHGALNKCDWFVPAGRGFYAVSRKRMESLAAAAAAAAARRERREKEGADGGEQDDGEKEGEGEGEGRASPYVKLGSRPASAAPGRGEGGDGDDGENGIGEDADGSDNEEGDGDEVS